MIYLVNVAMAHALSVLLPATSTLAWPAHSGCAVMVDDATVIANEAHLGQAASRGNPPLPHGRPPQHPQQHLQPFLLVYDVMGKPPGPAMPSRRMRRSVSHELPPRMDTHPPDSSSPSPHAPPDSPAPDPSPDSFPVPSHSSDSTPPDGSMFASPDDSFEAAGPNPAPSSPHVSFPARDSVLGKTFILSANDSPLDAPSSSAKPAMSSSAKSDAPTMEGQRPMKSAGSEASSVPTGRGGAQGPEGDVFAPVVEVVEYVSDEGNAELPEVDDSAFLEEDRNLAPEDSFLAGDDVMEGTVSSYGDDDDLENITEDVYEVEEEAGIDYVYNSNPESSELNVVEYVQANETKGNLSNSSLELPESYVSLPNSSLNTVRERNVSAEFLPVPLASDSLQSIMQGDDPSTSQAHEGAAAAPSDDRAKRERKVFGSWMGGFPKLPSSSEVDSMPGEDQPQGAQRPSPPEPGRVKRVLKSSVDTWFSRYGIKNTGEEGAGRSDTSSEGSSTSYYAAASDHFLFDSSERGGGRVSRRSAARRGTSYDPNDPKGGPIPQSDPGHYPSRILESLGVPFYQDPTKAPPGTNNRTYKGPVKARDVFPHIFEYDLDDHDDYYYEDDAYYYFDEYSVRNNGPAERESSEYEDTNDDDDSDDIILGNEAEDRLGDAEAAHRGESVVTMRAPPQRFVMLPPTGAPVGATQYPPGLRAMSLTKEEFHVGVGEPQVKTLTRGQDEVVEIEVIPLKREFAPVASMETGTNYSPVVDSLSRETTVERKVPETSTTTDTTTAAPTRATTSTRPPPPPLLPTVRLPEPQEQSPPPQESKASSPLPPHHHRPPAFSTENLTEGKKIPKFLMHIAGNKSAVARGSSPSSAGSPTQAQGRETHEGRVEANSHSSVTSNDEVVSLLTHPGAHGAQPPSSHTEKAETVQESPSLQELHRANRSPLQTGASVLSSMPGHSKRVTVNVTIATDDGMEAPGRTMNKKKPLYFLSVSVPTSGENQEADITLLEPSSQHEIASLSFPLNANTSGSSEGGSQAGSLALSPLQGDAPLPPAQEGGAPCQCPCACDSDAATRPAHSTPSHPQYPSQSHPEVAQTLPRPHDPNPPLPPRGCSQDPSATSTTTTTPPLPVEVVKDLSGETEHLHSVEWNLN